MTDPAPELEELALDCLARLETEGEQAIESACARHPEHAGRLRGMVAQLRKLGLVAGASDTLPERIGDYRPTRRLGGGGMGIVYLAHDPRLERTVALKVLRGAALSDDATRARFRREATTLAQLNHPGVSKVFEAGEVDGVPFLAMQYVEGDSLRERIDRWREIERNDAAQSRSSRARVNEALRIVEDIASAVHAVHERGIVHRDLKPDNVVITEGGRPVVLDFGLAGLADGVEPHLTASGDRLGTPAYMAPEQVRGDRELDRRTDVYGLGALLYECIVLLPAFTSMRREALYRSILTEDPRDPRALDSGVSPDLSAVIQRAMSKDVRARYPTALALADELGRLGRGEPVEARLPGPIQHLWLWCRRNVVVATALLLVTSALVATVLMLGQRSAALRRAEVLAILQFADEALAKNPLRAFQYAREALRRDVDAEQPLAVARLQEIRFELPNVRLIGSRDGMIGGVLWAPDGQSVLVTGPLVPAALFDLDGIPLHEFEENNPVACWRADGKELALTSADRTEVHRYRVENGTVTPLPAAPSHDERVTGLAWAADGRLLVSRTRGGRLWLPDGTLVELAHHGTGEFWQGAFLPDGRIVAAGALWSRRGVEPTQFDSNVTGDHGAYEILAGQDFLVIGTGPRRGESQRAVFVTLDGIVRDEIRAPTGTTLRPLAVSADGRRALIASSVGQLWIGGSGNRILQSQLARRQHVLAARFFDGGVLVCGLGGSVHRLDEDLGQQAEYRVPLALFDLAINPREPTQFVTGGRDGALRLWDTAARAATPCLEIPGARIAVNRDLLLVAAINGSVRVYDANRAVMAQTTIPAGPSFPEFAPDGKSAAFACSDGSLRTWNLGSDKPRELSKLPDFALPFESAPIFLPDAVVVQGARTGWRCEVGNGSVSALPLPPPFRSLTVLPDGGAAFAGDWQGQLIRASLAQPYNPRVLAQAPRPEPLTRLALSRGGGLVLAGSTDGNAYLWDVEGGDELAALAGHQHSIIDLAFALDERSAVTLAQDGFVRVFELPRGDARGPVAPRLTLRHEGAVQVRFVGPDRIVTAGRRQIRFWSLTRRALLEQEMSFGVPELGPEEIKHLENRLAGQESR